MHSRRKQKKTDGIFVSTHGKSLMNERQIENDCIKPLELWDLDESPTLTEIPIQFVIDLPRFIAIKIQPQDSMNHPLQTILTPQKPLIPALFRIAARAEEVGSVPALKKTVVQGHGPLSEMMLDPEKLEAVLEAIAKRKKPAVRRVSVSGRRISAGDSRIN